jgi:hypothetical protein
MPTERHPYANLQYCDCNNATYIDWQSLDDDGTCFTGNWAVPRIVREYYRKLDDYNRGIINGNWRNHTYYTAEDNEHLIQSLSGQLNLTEGERTRASDVFRSLELQTLGVDKSKIAFVVCCHAVEQNPRRNSRGHPQCRDEDINDTLLAMAKYLDVSRKMWTQLYGKIVYRINRGNRT